VLIRQFIERVRMRFRNLPFAPSWLLGGIVVLWLASGMVTIQPDEEGVMLRCGKVTGQVGPGLNWNWPWPIGKTFRPGVTRVQKIEVGFRTVDVGPPARYQSVPTEALMLTGDENIVSLEFIVQYKIKDSIAFLFRVRDPMGTLRDASEAAMREVVGKSRIDLALTEGKGEIQIQAQELIQSYMDQYDSGLQIVTVKLQDVNPPEPVNDAFKDVINAAQDKERKINEAKGFENDIIPAARGNAAQVVNEAEAYRQARVTEAEGESARFLALLREYRGGKAVTKTRLYLETLEEILPGMEKTILDPSVARNVLPYLPIDKTRKKVSTSGGGK